MSYSVKLHAFEGPLDLLLHLVQKNDLDLYDIPVREITDQYLTYVHAMQVLELDVASEYLVMAATLLQMKSVMLLPMEETAWEEDWMPEEEEAMSKEGLQARLSEYKKYKEAAGDLKERSLKRSELFTKPMSDLTPLLEESEEAGVEVTIFDMLQAFQKMNKRKKKKKTPVTRVSREEIPIEEKMERVLSRIAEQGSASFDSLLENESRTDQVTTFLAVLELMKDHQIHCTQSGNYGEIVIKQREEEAV
ncbi:segregation/condensation protein A [Alkalicoccus chagannorensis]|uniref:segregation/condensation protein A n=1 Tax=Alkalicoccus chagannorensis TaxID=427072 RepID=UPI00041B6346|nr:segregation/condensation protein A [Alkalicoccus chagannorensis]